MRKNTEGDAGERTKASTTENHAVQNSKYLSLVGRRNVLSNLKDEMSFKIGLCIHHTSKSQWSANSRSFQESGCL